MKAVRLPFGSAFCSLVLAAFPVQAQTAGEVPDFSDPAFGDSLFQEESPIDDRLDLDRSRFGFDWTRADAGPPQDLAYSRMVEDGELLLNYRYSRTEHDGLRDSRDDLSSDQLFAAGFDTVPTEMTTEVHTVDALYGLDDDWTIFATIPYVVKSMDNLTDMGASFETDSDGIGDVRVGAIRRFYDLDGTFLSGHLGIGIPTGEFDARDRDETGSNVLLPYQMQVGTGTVDLYPGVTFLQQGDDTTLGVYTQGRIHIEDNDDDWGISDSLRLSAWAAKGLTESLAASLRLDVNWWGDYHGQAAELDETSNPIENPHNQGGSRIDILGGLNYEIGDSFERQNRIAIEFGVPLDEWMDGPNLSAEWIGTVGWQLSL